MGAFVVESQRLVQGGYLDGMWVGPGPFAVQTRFGIDATTH